MIDAPKFQSISGENEAKGVIALDAAERDILALIYAEMQTQTALMEQMIANQEEVIISLPLNAGKAVKIKA